VNTATFCFNTHTHTHTRGWNKRSDRQRVNPLVGMRLFYAHNGKKNALQDIPIKTEHFAILMYMSLSVHILNMHHQNGEITN
jgi:hypothetical protein